jgi:hypothetical protein
MAAISFVYTIARVAEMLGVNGERLDDIALGPRRCRTAQAADRRPGTLTPSTRQHRGSHRMNTRYVASISEQEMIVWDLHAGQAVKTLQALSRGGFTDVSFAPDGRSLALADSAGRVWDVPFEVPEGPLHTEVCKRLPEHGREFTAAQMRELAFLRATDRAPCDRPPLLSFGQLRLLVRGIAEEVWSWWMRLSDAGPPRQ